MKCLTATQLLEETAHDHSPLQTVLPPCPFRKNSLNENAFLYKMYKYAQQKNRKQKQKKPIAYITNIFCEICELCILSKPNFNSDLRYIF